MGGAGGGDGLPGGPGAGGGAFGVVTSRLRLVFGFGRRGGVPGGVLPDTGAECVVAGGPRMPGGNLPCAAGGRGRFGGDLGRRGDLCGGLRGGEAGVCFEGGDGRS